MEAIGERVRQRLRATRTTQAELARTSELSDSQLSKSLSGLRQFSAPELARIAHALDVSLHWLVTGEPDPMEVRIAARHDFDGFSHTYSARNAESDQEILKDIALLYRQAYQ